MDHQVMEEVSALKARPAPAEVLVVGGGYAGVELAATLAEKLTGHGRVKVSLCAIRTLPVCSQTIVRSRLRC